MLCLDMALALRPFIARAAMKPGSSECAILPPRDGARWVRAAGGGASDGADDESILVSSH